MLLKLLDVNYFTEKLKPVKSTVIITRADKFHEEGLFSEEIFGREKSPERKTTFGYIELNAKIIHPAALMMLYRLDRRIKRFLSAESSFKVDLEGNLIEDPEGVTGISAFIELFPKIKFNPSEVSKRFVDVLEKSYNDGVLFINRIPVIPPIFRDVSKDLKTGELKIDPLNDYYITILKRSFSIKAVVQPGPLLDILTYGIQEAVVDLDDFVKTRLSKKFGLIRSQLLGKRIEFSSRAVIANGPTLKVNEIGIPFRMAIVLFEPFIIHILLYTNTFDYEVLANAVNKLTGQELSVESIKNVIKTIEAKDVIDPDIESIFYKAAEMAIKGRLVLAKRDPVLIPESVRAFHPVLISGNVVRLNNFQVTGFNADFDGDQMAIFHPLSDKAQEDAHKLLRGKTGESSNAISFSLNKESFLGLFLLTKEYKLKLKPREITDIDIEDVGDPSIPVFYKNKVVPVGKVIFNNALPKGFRFIETSVTKKIANALILEIYNKYGEEEAREVIYKLQTLGYRFSTLVGSSITLDMFDIPDSILRLKKGLDTMAPEDATKVIEQMRKLMIEHLRDTGLYDLCESGSTKGWDQPTQMLIAKGVISDVQGNLLAPIKGSFAEGLSPTEHFKASLGARKGIVDRVINTADTGYTSRQLAYLLNGVELDILLKDCKTKRTLTLKLTDDIIKRLTGRYIVENGNVVKFEPHKHKSGDTVNLRSPVYCKSLKMCHTCYGDLLYQHKTPYVGVLASQIIGERGTQLIMRCTDGLVHHDGNLIPFIDLFEMGYNYSKENDVETVEFDNIVEGKNGNVRTSTIQRHPATDKMLFITTQSGASMICQSNHPIFVRNGKMDDLKLIQASELKLNDQIWSDRSIIFSSKNNLIEDIDGYDTGKDFFLKNNEVVIGDSYKNRRLRYDFINFDKTWLSDFLSGIIDTYDGIIFNSGKVTCARIYTNNFYFSQQLFAICIKLGMKFNIRKSITHSWKYNVVMCDIRFYEDSIKLNKCNKIREYGDIKYLNKKDDKDIRFFDKVNTIEPAIWENPVYDVKTETEEYMLGCLQTHNTFHCLKKEQLVYVCYNDIEEVLSFDKLWKRFENGQIIITEDGKEEIEVMDLLVWDYDKFTKVNKLIRHKKDPSTKIMMIRSNNSDFIISQDNHPHMLSKNESCCKKCSIPYTKTRPRSIWECPSCKDHPHSVNHRPNEKFEEVEVKDIVKSKYFSRNSFPIWQEDEGTEPLLEPYLLGIYLSEGSLYYQYERIGGWIITQNEGVIYNNVKTMMEKYGEVKIGKNKKHIRIYDREFSTKLLNSYGRYSWEKSLPSNFIYYSDDTLSKILCGIIDGNGSVITTDDREYISIEITSLELVQQIHHILQKFNIEHKITLASIKKLTRHQSYILKIYPVYEHQQYLQFSEKCKNIEFKFVEYKENYDSLVTYSKEIIFDENEFLYDMETESSTLTSNGFWTHNTGGAIKIKTRDVINEFAENDPHLSKGTISLIFKQDKDKIIVIKPGTLILSLLDYTLDSDLIINEDDNTIWLKSLLGVYIVENQKINVILDAPVIVQIPEGFSHEKKNKITLTYDTNDEIFEIPIEREELKELVLYMRRLIGGREIFKDTSHLFMKLFRIYGGDISNMDLVHLEVLVSQCLRDKDRPILPARVGKNPDDPAMFNLKKNVFSTSFLQGLSFENIGEAIRTGLTSEHELEPSILERVLQGTLVTEEKGRKK